MPGRPRTKEAKLTDIGNTPLRVSLPVLAYFKAKWVAEFWTRKQFEDVSTAPRYWSAAKVIVTAFLEWLEWMESKDTEMAAFLTHCAERDAKALAGTDKGSKLTEIREAREEFREIQRELIGSASKPIRTP